MSEALVKRERVEEIRAYITKNTHAVKEALPRVGLTPEALTRTALSCIYKNPTLLQCEKTSLMRSIVEAAALGLSFHLGRAFLVPYRNTKMDRMEAQLIPGYLGLADIARRSGEVSSINAQAVYAGDEFDYEFALT
jgi:recombination protein RecT